MTPEPIAKSFFGPNTVLGFSRPYAGNRSDQTTPDVASRSGARSMRKMRSHRMAAFKGVNVFCGNRISPDDDTAMGNLAHTIIRASFSQERMQYLDEVSPPHATPEKQCLDNRDNGGNAPVKTGKRSLMFIILLSAILNFMRLHKPYYRRNPRGKAKIREASQ
jgi:hypothetical protein